MLGLNFGEWFLVAFVFLSIMVTPVVGRLGEAIGKRIARWLAP
jgi:hypothetical protein